MNYFKIYDAIIERAKCRLLNGYKEIHHIIPVCLGGTNKPENLVNLTAREHYIAHQLLVNMYPNHKGLKYAAYMMTIAPKGRRSNNRLYSWLKEDYYKNRPRSAGMTGKKHSEETRAKMKAKRAIQSAPSQETRDKISKTKKGVKRSNEVKLKMEERRKLDPNKYKSMLGKTQSEETRDKISKANKGRKFPQKECPHCGKLGSGPNMARYHFDNCKLKVTVSHLPTL